MVADTNNPKVTFNTSYPVWRARDLPFGRGVLSLPQRGENVLDVWSYDHPEAPVSVLEGHSDTVKEFVWRRGCPGKAVSLGSPSAADSLPKITMTSD